MSDRDDPTSLWQAARAGSARAFSVPGAVLFGSFVGFGALARASGLELGQSLFMTAFIWALPSQVVLVDQIGSGAGLVASAVAVTLTAIRLLPMTVSVLPVVASRSHSIPLKMLMAHFVAVTVWIETMRRVPDLSRDVRVPYYLGLSFTLVSICMVANALGFSLSGSVGVPVAAALVLLTPLYFLLSMLTAAKASVDWLAVAAGICLGPVFYTYAPGLDLLWTGLVGGTLAFGLSRLRFGRQAKREDAG